MDVNLESLIEKVKSEAVEQAQQAAAEIAAKAEAEAERIQEEARAAAQRIVADARTEAGKLEANAQQAVRQAARDAELMLKERLTELFDRIFRRQVGASMTPEVLARIIQQLATDWARQGQAEVSVSAADQQALEGLLLKGLGQDVKAGLTVRASNTISKGFRFEVKGGSVYYDFTDETIAETLKAFVNPSLRSMLDGNDG